MRLAVSLSAVFPDRSLSEAAATAADLGADGVEFFDWQGADIDVLANIVRDRGLGFAATLSAGAGSSIEETSPAMTDPDCGERAIADVERSLDVAADLGCHCLIVTTGAEQRDVPREHQREAVEHVLREVAPAAEDAGVTVVVEPLNVHVDHPGYFLTASAEAFDLIATVDSPRVKVLYDVYHQQITEGNVIETMTENLDAIGHVHVADVPGRGALDTGELDYRNIFTALIDAGYDEYVGLEFFPECNPETAVAQAVDLVREV